MQLENRTDGRNIVLIGGLNGRGKTTFLEAVLIALYGRQAMKYIQENARSYDRLLEDRINRRTRAPVTYTAVSLCLEDGTRLRVKRSWYKEEGRKLEESLEVRKNGTVDRYLGENWSYYIEEILPFGIARFFFFNNEKITQLADDASFEQMKTSIRSAIGVSVIDRAIEHTRAIMKKKKQTSGAEQGQEEGPDPVAELEKQIETARRDLESTEKAAAAREEKIAALNGQLEQKQTLFWASGGDLVLQRDQIRTELAQLKGSMEENQKEIQRLTSSPSTPLLLVQDLLRQVQEREVAHQKNQAKIQSQLILQDILDTVLSRMQDCRLDPISYTAVTGLITSVIQEFTPQADPSAFSTNLSKEAMQTCDDLLRRDFGQLIPEILRLTDGLARQAEELKRLEGHLENAGGQGDARQLFDAVRRLEGEKAVEETTLLEEQTRAISLRAQLETLNSRLLQTVKAVSARLSGIEDDNRILKYAAMGIEVLTAFRSRLQQEKLKTLSETTTRCFQTLAEKNSLVSRIEIDRNTLDVTLYDSHGRELLKSQLSAGEQQMFAVSVVWALALTSGYRAPVIIDTPMARLDSSHRANFVAKYLPSASSQVMVLSTDEEVYGKYYDLIADHLAATYTLHYDEKDQSTSIVPGYFRERR